MKGNSPHFLEEGRNTIYFDVVNKTNHDVFTPPRQDGFVAQAKETFINAPPGTTLYFNMKNNNILKQYSFRLSTGSSNGLQNRSSHPRFG